jgi:hypothetical protein
MAAAQLLSQTIDRYSCAPTRKSPQLHMIYIIHQLTTRTANELLAIRFLPLASPRTSIAACPRSAPAAHAAVLRLQR